MNVENEFVFILFKLNFYLGEIGCFEPDALLLELGYGDYYLLVTRVDTLVLAFIYSWLTFSFAIGSMFGLFRISTP